MWFFSTSFHLPHSLSLSLPSHLFPFSSPLPLQIDFAATWPRRNAITLSVCSLFPFFLFFLPLPFSSLSITLAPFICPPRETSRSLIAGMGLCRVRCASNRALSLKPIHIRVVPRGYRGLRGFQDDCRLCSITPCPSMEMSRDAFVTGDTCPG